MASGGLSRPHSSVSRQFAGSANTFPSGVHAPFRIHTTLFLGTHRWTRARSVRYATSLAAICNCPTELVCFARSEGTFFAY
ncbi:hypothetical protein FOMPIDRAFT_1024794 [Fomitopsis schrenkii]|uniref:Uncharacterized protein n=1 Tax=Fomitopsis schrenkii TaxID=2126942 RepID=S8DYG4_FOMSC|nr:hypothetical protein FOMPIDRAFT_1024794 [Fomitopsis schrenkii]